MDCGKPSNQAIRKLDISLNKYYIFNKASHGSNRKTTEDADSRTVLYTLLAQGLNFTGSSHTSLRP